MYLHRNNGNGQDSRLHPAYRHVLGQRHTTVVSRRDVGIGVTGPEDGLDITAGAGAGAVLVDGGDVDEGAEEGDVEDDGDERGQGEAGEAAEQQQADGGVENGGARDTLNCPKVRRDGDLVVGHGGHEVRVEGEDEPRAAELHAPVEPL